MTINVASFDTLRARLQNLVDEKRRAGIVLGIADRDETLLLEAYGCSDLAHGLPMSADTLFRIFSMTRAVSSAAILALNDAGILGLDDPVAQYLPEIGAMRVLDATGNGTVPQHPHMTIRHLLTYTAGFGYSFDWAPPYALRMDDIISPSRPTRDGIRRLAMQPLLNQPGAAWRYGFAGDVLGALAEMATGKKLDAILQERLLGPLGMNDTAFWFTPEKLSRMARAYGPAGGEDLADITVAWQAEYGTFDQPMAFLSAGGGLASTVPDYLRFCRMLLNGGALDGCRVLQPNTARMMMTPQIAGPQHTTFWYAPDAFDIGRDRPWSFGLAAPSDDAPAFKQRVAGWNGLMNTAFLIDPRRGLAAVVMSQYLGPDEDSLSRILYDGLEGRMFFF